MMCGIRFVSGPVQCVLCSMWYGVCIVHCMLFIVVGWYILVGLYWY